MSSAKKRIMSGMRPTGKLHFGHYFGVLNNWIKYQEEYDCFFAVADWHALTTKFDKTSDFKENVYNVVIDWLASGVNPDISTIYVQSLVPETAELHLYLSMITPQNWLERSPTLKDTVKILRKEGDNNEQNQSNLVSYGLLGYPVLQSADILQFNASLVPVGVDQVAHLEFSRDIARRFNHIYNTNFFIEPQPKLTETPLIKGLDGQKMGKSFNNDIKITDTEDETRKKIMKAITDRTRIKKTDPGHPELCEVVCPYFELFADEKTVKEQKEKCEKAIWGCKDCKMQLVDLINDRFKDIRQKATEYQNNKDYVEKIITEGNNKAREIVANNLKEIKKIIKLNY